LSAKINNIFVNKITKNYYKKNLFIDIYVYSLDFLIKFLKISLEQIGNCDQKDSGGYPLLHNVT